MEMTNRGLVRYAQEALREGWGYCLGAFGNTLTQQFLEQKCRQYPYNEARREYLSRFLGNRVTDCYGLVKGYVWSAGAEPVYNRAGLTDRNQETAFNAAAEKGTLATLPEIPGVILWMKGHAGVYTGGGEFIECCGPPAGMRKGTIKNGAAASGSKFTHWFFDTYIVYESEPKIFVHAAASYWAAESWRKATQKGVFDGTNPGGAMTREMTAVVLDKLGFFA
ncbi:MAG: hypothetical protein FWE82_08810 [Defluviitaleaceae bacterium]|nr:hypothetical protein [Defluviitaleaceae bacterium]